MPRGLSLAISLGLQQQVWQGPGRTTFRTDKAVRGHGLREGASSVANRSPAHSIVSRPNVSHVAERISRQGCNLCQIKGFGSLYALASQQVRASHHSKTRSH